MARQLSGIVGIEITVDELAAKVSVLEAYAPDDDGGGACSGSVRRTEQTATGWVSHLGLQRRRRSLLTKQRQGVARGLLAQDDTVPMYCSAHEMAQLVAPPQQRQRLQQQSWQRWLVGGDAVAGFAVCLDRTHPRDRGCRGGWAARAVGMVGKDAS